MDVHRDGRKAHAVVVLRVVVAAGYIGFEEAGGRADGLYEKSRDEHGNRQEARVARRRFQRRANAEAKQRQRGHQVARPVTIAALPLRVGRKKKQIDNRRGRSDECEPPVAPPETRQAENRQQNRRRKQEDRFSGRYQKSEQARGQGRLKRVQRFSAFRRGRITKFKWAAVEVRVPPQQKNYKRPGSNSQRRRDPPGPFAIANEQGSQKYGHDDDVRRPDPNGRAQKSTSAERASDKYGRSRRRGKQQRGGAKQQGRSQRLGEQPAGIYGKRRRHRQNA